MTDSTFGTLNPGAIGEVVTIQVFEREKENSDTLKNDFSKSVGILKAYSVTPTSISVLLEGCNWIDVAKNTYYVECYIYDQTS